MTDRNRIYNHEELEAEIQRARDKEQTNEASRFKKSKHSLDSDEEDDDEKAEKYNVLDPSELEGQEEGTIDYDAGIKITPFNMKEELEEGYFDKEGTYIFTKETDVIKDQWLDDIDWIKVKATEGIKRKVEDESSDEELQSVNLVKHYTEMLEIMKPKETVLKAIRRLGGSSSRSASSRWKKKKESTTCEETSKDKTEVDAQKTEDNQKNTMSNSEKENSTEGDIEKNENYENLQLLTSLANDILLSGDMDIYQQTYEKLSYYINSHTNNLGLNGKDTTDASLDMFGEEFDEKVDETKSVQHNSEITTSAENINTESEVMWEFKWENTDDAKVYGSYSTSQMLQWVQEKYFDDGVLVRQVGKQDGRFYSSKRIDFELYL